MKPYPKSRNSRRHSALLPPIREFLRAVHGSLIAALGRSLITRHCPNQSLAKHNRKPLQVVENNQQRSKSIASFCRVFHPRSARRANTTRVLIDATAFRNVEPSERQKKFLPSAAPRSEGTR
jgi:hypothetical protein